MVNRWHILFGVVLLAGCQQEQLDDCITRAGQEREEIRMLESFTTVDLNDRIDLVLEERSSHTISITAGRNLLDQVSTEVRDSVLYITNGNRCNWVRSFKPRITVGVSIADVAKLILRGTGNVTNSDTLVRDHFSIDQFNAQGTTTLTVDVNTLDVDLHTGAGDIKLYGRCDQVANLYSGIMSPMDASGMSARFVNVNNSGVSDIRCWATEGLTVQLRDVGDVYYRDVPLSFLETDITGSGELIPY
ncbi:MAG: DUF2807 domain-containing protein [Flavobacteriales bacterium]|mgnify:FL=1|nr:DUF2807 domain-containing protein [Flavobacteriales bacterium]MBK6946265.1 DUF2807 domain-containing protein [Flavobacteriales bacterium]MBK7238784.1 DUF2807 domain-containing protein [Flavobacteriales bacterium]MBK7297643.1 DUF2807 domain-containing protein [Flavobacteriales bacterium]MBK9537091.1 DUF2807 domain-containing protein [Flavobacteriales bacterium]